MRPGKGIFETHGAELGDPCPGFPNPGKWNYETHGADSPHSRAHSAVLGLSGLESGGDMQYRRARPDWRADAFDVAAGP